MSDDRLAHLRDRELYKQYYNAAVAQNEQLFSLPISEPRVHWTVQHIGREDRVIDIGCYKMDLTEWIVQCTRAQVVGIDIAESALTEGKKRAGCSRVRLICSDAAALPFRDNCFDVAVITEVLEHVPDEYAVIAEAERVVRPGGRIIVSVPANAEGWDNDGDRQEKSKMGFELNAHVREFIPKRVLGRKFGYQGEYFFQKYSRDGSELGHRCAVYTVVK